MKQNEFQEYVLDMQLPMKLQSVFTGPARYRGAHGGRGSGKSWGFADMAIMRTMAAPTRFLCTRELQNSIRDSVLRLLVDRIEHHGLQRFYDSGESYLRSVLHGEDFIFKGLRHNYREIKSLEGVIICWIEEAETTSEESFRVLIPTIRAHGSEIWMTWNSESLDAPIHKRFILAPPDNAKIAKVNWIDNPWFPEELNQERLADQKRDPDIYAHVWEGECLTRTDAQVLANKWRVDDFIIPDEPDGGPYYGVDWGFATDPLAIVRCFVHGKRLFVDYEAGGKGIEIKDTPAEFLKVPRIKDHIIRADNARPEMIAHMQSEGFRCIGADKWPGSVEDGITHLRSYDEIVIHSRCDRVAREARLWSYKIDKQSGDVLPVLLDLNNHFWDGVRYALAPLIRKRVFTGKPVYAGQFNDRIHVSLDELWPIKGLPIVVGLAMKQTTYSAVFSQINRDGQLRILEEVISRNMGVGQFARTVLNPLFKQKYRGCKYTIVSFRPKTTTARGTDDEARMLIDEMDSAGFTVDSVDSNLLSRRMESVRWYLGQLAAGKPAISISPTCTILNDGMGGGYQFRQLENQGTHDIRYDDKPEDNQYVLPNEALQYICMYQRGELEMAGIQPVVSEYRVY